MNKYDLLSWWTKVLMSCETEDQFKNALNLWPKVNKLAPCTSDAWQVVVESARVRFHRAVPEPRIIFGSGRLTPYMRLVYPKSGSEIINHIFN